MWLFVIPPKYHPASPNKRTLSSLISTKPLQIKAKICKRASESNLLSKTLTREMTLKAINSLRNLEVNSNRDPASKLKLLEPTLWSTDSKCRTGSSRVSTRRVRASPSPCKYLNKVQPIKTISIWRNLARVRNLAQELIIKVLFCNSSKLSTRTSVCLAWWKKKCWGESRLEIGDNWWTISQCGHRTNHLLKVWLWMGSSGSQQTSRWWWERSRSICRC